MTPRTQKKRRIADQLRAEVKRMNVIAAKAEKLGVFIPRLDLSRLALEFGRAADLLDEQIDAGRWVRQPQINGTSDK